MADIFEIVGKVSLDGVDKAEKELNGLTDTGEKSSGKLSKFGSVMGTVGKGVLAVGGAVASGSVALVKTVQSSYGELQQNLGGSEAVFGQYAKNIQKYGEDAYKNMGISQAEYLATANKMGSLLQGSGISQQESLDMTAKAMQRASDVASVMGIDMTMAMESITGACKGNFTMMDNLGVAMNATTLEAYALEKGIEGFSWKTASQMEKNTLAMQMFLERTEQYAGNFARESTETISGSIGYLSASWKDFLAGLGNPEADMSRLTNNLAQSFGAMINNIVPIVENIAKALPTVMTSIINAVNELAPSLIETFTGLITQVINGIIAMLPTIIPLIVDTLRAVIEALVQNLPLVIDAVILLVTEVINTLGEMLPTLIPMVIQAVIDIATSLLDNLPTLIDAVINMTLGVVDAIIQSIPVIVEAIPKIITALITAIGLAIPKLQTAGLKLFTALLESLPTILDSIENLIPSLIETILTTIINAMPMMIEVGMEFWMALLEFLPVLLVTITETLPDIVLTIGRVIINAIPQIVTAITKAVPQIWDAFSTSGTPAVEKIKPILMNVVNMFVEWGKSVVDTAKTTASEFLNKVVEFFKNLPENVAFWLGATVKNIINWASDMKVKAKETGENFVKNVINFFKELPGNVKIWFDNTIVAVKNFITEFVPKAIETGREFTENLVNSLKKLPDKMREAGKNVVYGLWNGITSAGSWLKERITGFANNIISSFKAGFDSHSPARKMIPIGKWVTQGLGVGILSDDSAEESIGEKVNRVLGVAENSTANIKIGTTVDGVIPENPMQKYQVDFNTQISALGDGFDRLIGLVGEYLPNISEKVDRPITLDGKNLTAGISRTMDAQLGKIAIAKGRGNV